MRCRGCNTYLIPGYEICDDCERDELHAERDRYLVALQKILALPNSTESYVIAHEAVYRN